MEGVLMAWHDIITDSLVRHYWLEKWWGDCKGVVEYLSEWVRDYTTPEDAKLAGIGFVVVICITLAIRGVEFLRKPAEGETIWETLKKGFFNEKE
jgi:hypothetical protein